jgi:chaperone required for assembly of F1-ATPase
MSITAKSAAIALALLYKGDDELTIEEAVSIARLDTDYQSSIYGKVEGAHDMDQAYFLNTFATARSLVNLC